jgi:hypothetical protein
VRRRTRFLLLGTVAMLAAYGSVGAHSAEIPKKLDASIVDAPFAQPYIDSDEWRETPVRHRRVHGGFKGTDTRFTIYFPPKEQFRGRFFQPLPATAGVDNSSERATGPNTPIGFAAASGGYLVDSNQGRLPRYTSDDLPMVPWRASAATAKYSRVLAAEMYGPGRIYGYVYGGSGGSYKTFGCIENTVGIWDGAVPYIMETPMSLPNNYTVKGHALRLLQDKFPAIIDAVDPGGSGDMYKGLNEEEREALYEATRMGFPPRAWFLHERLGMGPIAGSIFDQVQERDPTYFSDFWEQPGYLGAKRSASLMRARIQHKTTLTKVALNGESTNGTIGVTNLPKGDLVGASVTVKSGPAAGAVMYISNVVGGAIRVGFGMATNRKLESIKPGDEVFVDNSAYLAAQTLHRHTLPAADMHSYDVLRGKDGKPKYPQRSVVHGPRRFLENAGSTHSGEFDGKIIVVNTLMDEHAFPVAADWYRSKVKAVLGSRIDDRYRLWYSDHALHGGPSTKADNLRVVSYTGILQQALRDLSAWVEKGVPPAPTTNYRVVDGQVEVPATAAERKGVQPVVTLTANGAVRADVAVGQRVSFAGVIETPPNTGTIVSAEWDFEGVGDYPVVEKLADTRSTRVSVTTTYAFSKPGTYFPVLRAASQRDGDATTPYARMLNLARVRVVVK